MKAAREVNAFRRVVEALAAPGLLAWLSDARTSTVVSQPLPIADESPFAALPDEIETRSEGAGAGAPARASSALRVAFPPLSPATPLAAAPFTTASARPATLSDTATSGSAPLTINSILCHIIHLSMW